jgi:hypothetical protein
MAQIPILPQFYVGRGVDSASGKVYARAIKYKDPEKVYGQKAVLSVESVTSSREMTDKLDVGVNLSLSALKGGVSAEFKLTKSREINTYNTYTLIKVSVTNPPWVLREPEFLDEPKDLLKRGKWDEFFEMYGREYIEGEIAGGQYYALVHIQTSKATDQQEVRLKLSAHYGPLKAGVELNKTLEEIQEKYSMNVLVIQSGGSGDILELKIDQMLEQARNFPQLVKDNPVPIAALTSEYKNTVPLPPGTPSPSSLPIIRRRETLEELGREYLKLRDYKGNLTFVLEHLPEFDEHRGLEAPQLEQKRAEYETDLNATAKELDMIVNSAEKCASDYHLCKTYVAKIQPKSLPRIGGDKMNLKQLEDKVNVLEQAIDQLSKGERPFTGVTINGDMHLNGDMWLKGGQSIRATGRMHITGTELLFLLNKDGVVIGKEWEGNGNLTVEGQIQGAINTLHSNNRRYSLNLQDDRNLVLYEDRGGQWVAYWDTWQWHRERLRGPGGNTKKTSLQHIKDPFKIIESFHGITLANGERENRMPIPVTAQEVARLFPDLVYSIKGEKFIDYQGLIALIIEMIRSQRAQFEELRTDIKNRPRSYIKNKNRRAVSRR